LCERQDTRFAKEEHYDWLSDWKGGLEPLIAGHAQVKTTDRILMVGCGNSSQYCARAAHGMAWRE
jgi:hypothetical protein